MIQVLRMAWELEPRGCIRRGVHKPRRRTRGVPAVIGIFSKSLPNGRFQAEQRQFFLTGWRRRPAISAGPVRGLLTPEGPDSIKQM
jgi:hypothetical protein